MATQVTSLNIVAGNGADVDLVVDIPSGFDQVLGRDASADISLPDPAISRRHAHVRRGPDGVWLEDLESTNGTYINGDRLTVPYRLRDGDEVRLGNSLAIFHDASSAPDATEVLAIPAPAVPGHVASPAAPAATPAQARRRHPASCHPGGPHGGPGPPGDPFPGRRRGARTPVTPSSGTGGARSLDASAQHPPPPSHRRQPLWRHRWRLHHPRRPRYRPHPRRPQSLAPAGQPSPAGLAAPPLPPPAPDRVVTPPATDPAGQPSPAGLAAPLLPPPTPTPAPDPMVTPPAPDPDGEQSPAVGVACPACSANNQADAWFCGRCAHQLRDIALPAAGEPGARASATTARLTSSHGEVRGQEFRQAMRAAQRRSARPL